MPVRAPSRTDPVARLATGVVGGPVGRRAITGSRGIAPAISVLTFLASLLVALGVLSKNHCIDRGWSAPDALNRMCYSDLPAAAGTTAGAGPYAGAGAPGQTQPFLTALLTWALRLVVPDGAGLERQQWYLGAAAVTVVLLLGLTVLAVAAALPADPWRAAHVALSPLLVTSALISLDLFGVALLALGLASWARRRPLLAGLLLGAATAARTFPALAVVAVVAVAWREGRRAEGFRVLLGAGAALLACVGGVLLAGGDLLAPYRGWASGRASYGSVAMVLGLLGVPVSQAVVTGVAVAGVVVSLGVGLWLGLDRRREAPPAVVALVMLVIVLLTSPSVSVQAALWLLPLVALSSLSWRDHLVWAGVELVAFAATWLSIAASSDPAHGLPKEAYALVTAARMLAWCWLARRALRLASAEAARRRDALALREEELVRTSPRVVALADHRARAGDAGGASPALRR